MLNCGPTRTSPCEAAVADSVLRCSCLLSIVDEDPVFLRFTSSVESLHHGELRTRVRSLYPGKSTAQAVDMSLLAINLLVRLIFEFLGPEIPCCRSLAAMFSGSSSSLVIAVDLEVQMASE